MSGGYLNSDFVQNLENTLSNRRVNEKATNRNSNEISNNDGNNFKSKTSEDHFYENMPIVQEVQYENGEFLMRNKHSFSNARTKQDPQNLHRHRSTKNLLPTPRTDQTRQSNLKPTTPHVSKTHSNDENIYDDVLNTNQSDSNNLTMYINFESSGQPKSSPSFAFPKPDMIPNSKTFNKPQTNHQPRGMGKKENIQNLKIPPPLPQNSKMKSPLEDTKEGLKTLPVEKSYAGGSKESILKRLPSNSHDHNGTNSDNNSNNNDNDNSSNSNNNTKNINNNNNNNNNNYNKIDNREDADNFYEELAGVESTREMKGFMECSRLDRSVKVAASQESWTRYFLFLTEGILSFFEKETDLITCNDLPLETTFLKNAAILMNKPDVNIITIHCCNGISYRMTNKNAGTVQLWFNTLKNAVSSLKVKQMLLPKNSPCVQPIRAESFLNNTGILVSNAYQVNKAKLIQFIKKRITKQELKILGIYKEPTFGGTLEATCLLDGSQGPPTFLKQIIEEIYKRGLSEDGLYRKSGSISAIQTIRLQINEGVYQFSEVMDVHTLTGVVKLYFRELANPLIPSSICDSFAPLIGLNNNTKKIEALSNLVIDLPLTHRNTLKYLFKHLKRVCDHESSNRMSMKNISLIFGPTLTWSEEGGNIHRMLTVQAQLVECLLKYQASLFKEMS